MYEYELEAELEGEWEGEWEGEFEGELEAEYEGEEFFRSLGGVARRGLQSPLLRRAGAVAARAARTLRPVGARLRPAIRRAGLNLARTGLAQLGDIGGAVGGAPGTPGSHFGTRVGGALGDLLGSFLPDSEFEGEWEFEGEMNPLRRVYPDALMEHLSHAATETESEEEAEALVGSLIPSAELWIPRLA